jgi:hypothetical protein
MSDVVYVVIRVIGDDPSDYAAEIRREDGQPFSSDGLGPQANGVLVNAAWSMSNGWQLVDSTPPVRSIVTE